MTGLLGVTRAAVEIEIRRTLRRRRFLVTVGLFLLAPAILALVAHGPAVRGGDDAAVAMAFMLAAIFIWLQVFVPIAAILHGTSMIQDEQEDRTLAYLTCRPIPRSLLLLAKWAANSLALAALGAASVGVGAAAFSLVSGRTLPAEPVARLAGAIALAAPVHTALYVLVSLLVKRAIIAGFLLAWVSEVATYIPAVVRKLTVTHYILSALVADEGTAALLRGDMPAAALPSTGLDIALGLLAFTGGSLLLSCLIFSRMDLAGARRAEDEGG